MRVVKLNGPEWLPRAQETHWPCKASMYLHIAVVWGQTYALHGMEWPLPAFSGSLTVWVVGWHHVFSWWKKGQSLLHGASEAACL